MKTNKYLILLLILGCTGCSNQNQILSPFSAQKEIDKAILCAINFATLDNEGAKNELLAYALGINAT